MSPSNDLLYPPEEAADVLRDWVAWSQTCSEGLASSLTFVRDADRSYVRVAVLQGSIRGEDAPSGAVWRAASSESLSDDAVERLLDALGPVETMLPQTVSLQRAATGYEVLVVGLPSATVSATALDEHCEGLLEAFRYDGEDA